MAAMKIKKPVPAAAPAAPAAGGAILADRFKLEPTASKGAKGGTTSKGAATAALIAAFIALAVAGVLAYMLYAHAAFLSKAIG